MLPMWLASFTADEHERFAGSLRRATPLRDAGLMIAWLLDTAPDGAVGVAWEQVPPALRAVHRVWWRRRYERRFGTLDERPPVAGLPGLPGVPACRSRPERYDVQSATAVETRRANSSIPKPDGWMPSREHAVLGGHRRPVDDSGVAPRRQHLAQRGVELLRQVRVLVEVAVDPERPGAPAGIAASSSLIAAA